METVSYTHLDVYKRQVRFRAVKKRKGFYYRNLNSFVVNQLGSRMRKEGFSLAVVCVLMYLSVSVMGTGTGLGQSFIKEKYQMAPFDLSVIYYYDGVENLDDAVKRESVRAVLGDQLSLIHI